MFCDKHHIEQLVAVGLIKVAPPGSPPADPCAFAIEKCARCLRGLTAGAMTEGEFNYNLFLQLADIGRKGDERCWDRCIALLDEARFDSFRRFARDELIPVDFMPYPGPFCPNTAEKYLAEMRAELRPVYLALYERIEARANGCE